MLLADGGRGNTKTGISRKNHKVRLDEVPWLQTAVPVLRALYFLTAKYDEVIPSDSDKRQHREKASRHPVLRELHEGDLSPGFPVPVRVHRHLTGGRWSWISGVTEIRIFRPAATAWLFLRWPPIPLRLGETGGWSAG